MRRRLAYYSVALSLPLLVFAAVISWTSANNERERVVDASLATARQVATAIDREINGLKRALEALALSYHLEIGDFEGFRRQAQNLAGRLETSDILLLDTQGSVVIDVMAGIGAAPLPAPLLDLPAMAQAGVSVTGLLSGATYPEPQFNVTVPVTINNVLTYFLTLSVPAIRMRTVLLGPNGAPATWVQAIVDRNGVILARNLDHDRFVGQLATEDLRRNATGREGTWFGSTADGRSVLGAYARVSLSGWRVAVGVPAAELSGPMWRWAGFVAASGFVAILFTALFAHLFGRRIILPMQSLAAEAKRLGEGGPVNRVESVIPEIRTAADALAYAAEQLAERERALRQANETLEARVAERTAELRATNQQLRAEAAQRERAEAQLRQAQKMEAVGQLTGGIAHDFNNMLAVIVGGLNLLKRRLERGDTDVGRYVDAALDGAGRAAALTQRLLAFSRQQPLSPKPVDANALVQEMHDLLQRTLGESVEVRTVLADDLWTTNADPNQLENSLLNLAVNARDAMGGKGVVTIETANRASETREGGPAGEFVTITVRDTGTGMTPEVAARAIDPFFTTKGVGKGTGLGLSQVYGFARQSGGSIDIDTAPGAGTAVRVYLPRYTGPVVPPEEPPGVADLPESRPQQARGTILVVEDEAQVRELTVAMLRDLGYTVIHAADTATALSIIDTTPHLDLLLSDIMMPESAEDGTPAGILLAREARRRRPHLQVLYMTGYARDAAGSNPDADVLAKPFTAEQLAARVAQVIAAN